MWPPASNPALTRRRGTLYINLIRSTPPVSLKIERHMGVTDLFQCVRDFCRKPLFQQLGHFGRTHFDSGQVSNEGRESRVQWRRSGRVCSSTLDPRSSQFMMSHPDVITTQIAQHVLSVL